MEEEIKKEIIEVNDEQLPAEINTLPLKESTKDIINKIINENDVEKIKDLSKAFNINQVKKNLVRVVKLGNLMDKVEDQAIARIEQRPDEISNKELLDYLQVIQNSIDKSQKSIETIDATPMVQFNNQEINVNMETKALDRDSKERVLEVVQKLVKFTQQPQEPEIKEPVMVDLGTNESEEK